MPPARRQLKTLGSLPLVGYANNPSKVITELAFIADECATARLTEGVPRDVDAPLEVQFNTFMEGVNSRGKGTKAKQRKMTVEQAAAVLLVTVQKGHVELITKADDPHVIDMIRILPEAKRILATFLPKLRGYGDIPYDNQYRGAIALAKRHFFPKGQAPTKKELMALLLQSHQERRTLRAQYESRSRPTQTLAVQTSIQIICGSSEAGTTGSENAPYACSSMAEVQSNLGSNAVLPNDGIAVDVESTPVASELDPEFNDDTRRTIFEQEAELDPFVAATPVAPRSLNPYLTPVSNSRHVDQMISSLDASPTLGPNSDSEAGSDEGDLTVESVGEMLQATATSQGKLSYWYNMFIAACRKKITFLEGERDEALKRYDFAQRKLDEVEQRLREADADRFGLKRRVKQLVGLVNSVCGQLQQGVADGEVIKDDGPCMQEPWM